MIQLRSFLNVFNISELRRKILFTLGCLIVFRLGSIIPVPGINLTLLGEYLKQASNLGLWFNYLDTYSGASLSQCRLFALGIGPYITASIAIQLFGMTIPYFEELMKEGEYGRKIMNQYTRYLTLVLAIVYSFGYAGLLQKQGIVLNPGIGFTITFVAALTAGAMFVMWLGDQITLYGLGNGSSMIIFAGIVSSFPNYFQSTVNAIWGGEVSSIAMALVLAFFILIIACIVFLEKGDRKIPIQYARKMIGNRVYGGQSSYIPFKVNPVGVMPVIFAQAALQFPGMAINILANYFPTLDFLKAFASPQSPVFSVMQFLLIIFFTFVWTALQFNPDELADNLKKNGGFIPGVRPGKSTAHYLDYILNRVGLVGAIYLGILAITPNILLALVKMPFYLGGTSLLIVVGVALEFSSQAESYLIEHRYEGFLSSGRVKSRV
ncbi:preprotein translocase subunit SecY [candidate division TM6 bacterium RIFCSPHIGHO2_12_FULL_36_22]|nr:MAG: preprotein translocase subunit SecY [candidate division TM6 bacterium RIFCSPHIGHO2_12_FULL_36_22]